MSSHNEQDRSLPASLEDVVQDQALYAEISPAEGLRLLDLLRRRDAVLRAVSYIAEHHLYNKELARDTTSWLKALGQAVRADRVTLVQKAPTAACPHGICSAGEWSAVGFPAGGERTGFRPRPGNEPIPGIERWERLLAQGRTIAGRSVEFPETERRLLDEEGILSVAVVPIFVEGAHWGHVCFDLGRDETWYPEILSALRIAAGIIGATIRFRRDQEEIEQRVRERTAELDETNRQLSCREALYRGLVETTPSSIALFDLDRRFLMMNPRSVELLCPGAVSPPIGDLVEDWVRAEDDSAAEEFWRDLMVGGRVEERELLLRRRDGSTMWARASACLIRDQHGNPRNTLHVARDVTRHKEIEERLRQVEKMDAVGRLASGIAHDFNNVLTVVRGFGALLAKHLESDALRHHMAIEIVAAAERAAALVERLLAFARKQMVQPTIIEVNASIEAIGAMLRALLQKDVTLVTELAPDAGSIRVDAGHFDQLVMNLAVNAKDAMPSGGILTIRTRCADPSELPPSAEATHAKYVLLEVQDTGIGMSQEVRSHIFEPFFTTKEAGKGTGIGLATVYGIIQQARGHVTVITAPGAGCAFRIYLPQASAGLLNAGKDQGSCPVEERAATILVAESEVSSRALITAALTDCGYTVLEAGSGIEALDAVARHGARIDLLIAEVVMPRMGGVELRDHLSALQPNVPVLYISNSVGRGVDSLSNVLKKPFSPNALIAKVRAFLAQ